MKKLTLTIGCALAVAGAAFAQGTANWSTISPGGYTAQTNSTTYSPLFGGAAAVGGTIGNVAGSAVLPNGYFYELLYLGGAQVSAPTTLAGLNAWSDAGLAGVQGATAGRLSPVAPTTAATVPWAVGTTDNIVLVGWLANLGTSWGMVSSNLNHIATSGIAGQAFFGISAAGYEAPNPADPGQTFVGGGANGGGTPIQSLLTPLYLVPIPEPATLALAGLGGLSLLLFRRQRK